MKMHHRFAVAALALAVASAPASAQIVFSGSTAGSFSTPNSALTFTGSTFNDATFNNVLSFGAIAGNVNNFGTFSLTNTESTFGGTFDLFVTLTSPTGILPGGQNQTFSAVVSGAVNAAGNGGVSIDFDNAFRAFTFTGSTDNPTTPGTFELRVNDVSINGAGPDNTNTIALSGDIRASTVPEPSTYALMAAGLAALGFVSRRRRTVA